MQTLIRPIAVGTAIGGLAAVAYFAASSLPPAIADEGPIETVTQSADDLMPSHKVDPKTLVRIGDEAWSITTDPYVSLTAVSTRTVRKVAFGKVSVVSITTTASGVYSSDGMVDPHFRYPGIHVQRVYPDAAGKDEADGLAYWSPDFGWVPAPAVGAGSFVLVAPFEGGVLVRSPKGNCVLIEGIAAC